MDALELLEEGDLMDAQVLQVLMEDRAVQEDPEVQADQVLREVPDHRVVKVTEEITGMLDHRELQEDQDPQDHRVVKETRVIKET